VPIFAVFAVLSKKTGKDTFVKKTLTCETAAAPQGDKKNKTRFL
jgi:hypothetical protein